jgi:methylaspartate mutase epsilon subunit
MVADLGRYVREAAGRGELVVQPRMGMADPAAMAAGIASVARLPIPTVATITIDSYTRVGDHIAAARALSCGGALNGFPIVSHGPELTAQVAAAAAPDVPVQVRHGSARPGAILATMAEAGLTASEGGPVSYCLPYGRTPLAEAVAHWGDSTETFGELVSHRGGRAHLETFGGCLLGQLCPPSLLIAMSVLEAMFFVQHGLDSVSLSYAQQCHPVQDVEALAALDRLAGEMLPDSVDRHIVLYTYMGVFPRTTAGARSLLADSARIAVLGGAQRLIVKTDAEAHRIPTVAENLSSLGAAAAVAARARQEKVLPDRSQVDCSAVLDEARRLVHAVLEISGDVGRGLVGAFATGVLDVPYCLHEDNAGLTRGAIDDEGRLYWARTGRMPLPALDRAPVRAVTSGDLLRMLNHTAERHDLAALGSAADVAAIDAAPADDLVAASPPGDDGDAMTDTVLRVAVVGSGPRGLSVVERLAARSAQGSEPGRLDVWLIDDVEVGCGRIWRTDQSPWLLMNTAAGEVTMFSGPPDDGPARAGAGPSLAEWWADADPENADPDGYAPRAVYGRYLRYVLDRVEATAPAGRFTLHRVLGRVEDAHREDTDRDGWTLHLRDGRDLEVDRVVLTTGHPVSEPPEEQRRLEAFAAQRPGVQYIRGDSTADLPLDRIPPGTEVGVIGLGLSFYDVLAEMTLGRGGRFVNDGADGAGGLRYLPSGREPVLIAGSRGGVPLRARGRNQKLPDHRYHPRILTVDRIRRLRALGPVDFRADVLPLLGAEIDLVHLLTTARARAGTGEIAGEDALLENLERDVDLHGVAGAVGLVRERLGLIDVAGLDLETLARPFRDRAFASPADYRRAVGEWIDDDLAAAAEGNVDGPLKAALDVIRDVRAVLREAVDFGGLSPESHEDFLRWFVPLASFLSTGPPMVRLAQTQALLDAGVLVLVGPGTRFGAGPEGFVVESPQVAGSRRTVRVLLDARTPVQDLTRDTSGLSRRLHSRGVLTTFTNTSGTSSFRTGGVTVTPAPFHSVGLDGPDPTLYVLGIPTEFTRWFTQVGSGRPRVRTGFTADADAIAADLLSAAAAAPQESRDRRPHEMIKESA